MINSPVWDEDILEAGHAPLEKMATNQAYPGQDAGRPDAILIPLQALSGQTPSNAEIARLRKHRKARIIPKREAGKLLVATWNIAHRPFDGLRPLCSQDRGRWRCFRGVLLRR